MEKRIETERLILRPLTENDVDDVFEWAGDPIVNKYMPYPVHKSPERVVMLDPTEWLPRVRIFVFYGDGYQGALTTEESLNNSRER